MFRVPTRFRVIGELGIAVESIDVLTMMGGFVVFVSFLAVNQT